MTSIGKNVIEGFWNGINNAWDWLVGKISGFFGGVEQAIKDFFGIASPSKKAMTWGKFLVEGFVVGMESMADKVDSAIQDVMGYTPTDYSYTGHGGTSLAPAFSGAYNMVDRLDAAIQGGDIVIHQHIQTHNQTPYEEQMAAVSAFERLRWT